MRKEIILLIPILAFTQLFVAAQDNSESEMTTVRPVEIDDVLINPGIGFTTFQRFNGDELNKGMGWTEGLPIVYREFNGDLTNKDYPQTSIAYFRINWRFIEPEQGNYNWSLIDKALRVAAERGQTLMLRISPYEGGADKDVPDWYREMTGPETKQKVAKWRVDPEDPRYIKYFGGLIEALGQRYDGHPDLESVDVALVGYWGEGEGGHLLSDATRLALINAYLDNFKKTYLNFQPLNGDAPDPGVLVEGTRIAASWPDGRNNGTGPEMRHLGWRIDCLGDMGFWPEWGWNHMTDVYPQHIIKSGMSEAWKKAPVAMEICGTFQTWLKKHKYDKETVQYIFDEALKWHVSSFNAKSSAVPEEWQPLVDEWLKKMGYRFVIRKLAFSSVVAPQGQLLIESWWENKGVAPLYKDYMLAFRLINPEKTEILPACVDLKTWFPGDIVYDENLYIPYDMPPGKYDLQVGIVSPQTFEPQVKLAVSGITGDGWYQLGEVEVKNKIF